MRYYTKDYDLTPVSNDSENKFYLNDVDSRFITI